MALRAAPLQHLLQIRTHACMDGLQSAACGALGSSTGATADIVSSILATAVTVAEAFFSCRCWWQRHGVLCQASSKCRMPSQRLHSEQTPRYMPAKCHFAWPQILQCFFSAAYASCSQVTCLACMHGHICCPSPAHLPNIHVAMSCQVLASPLAKCILLQDCFTLTRSVRCSQ